MRNGGVGGGKRVELHYLVWPSTRWWHDHPMVKSAGNINHSSWGIYRAMETGQGTILQKYWVRNSCIHLAILSISLLSFCPPFLPFYSCVLFYSLYFFQFLLWAALRVWQRPHFFTPLRGQMWLFGSPRGSFWGLCTDLCMQAWEMYDCLSLLFRCSVAFLSPALLNPCYKISTEKMMKEATGLQESAIT